MKTKILLTILVITATFTHTNANNSIYHELQSLSGKDQMVILIGIVVACGLRKLFKPEKISTIDYVDLANRFCENNPLQSKNSNLEYAMRYSTNNE